VKDMKKKFKLYCQWIYCSAKLTSILMR